MSDYKVENKKIVKLKRKQKNYYTPELVNLGKMQKVTLNTKGASTLESNGLAPEFL